MEGATFTKEDARDMAVMVNETKIPMNGTENLSNRYDVTGCIFRMSKFYTGCKVYNLARIIVKSIILEGRSAGRL